MALSNRDGRCRLSMFNWKANKNWQVLQNYASYGTLHKANIMWSLSSAAGSIDTVFVPKENWRKKNYYSNMSTYRILNVLRQSIGSMHINFILCHWNLTPLKLKIFAHTIEIDLLWILFTKLLSNSDWMLNIWDLKTIRKASTEKNR